MNAARYFNCINGNILLRAVLSVNVTGFYKSVAGTLCCIGKLLAAAARIDIHTTCFNTEKR